MCGIKRGTGVWDVGGDTSRKIKPHTCSLAKNNEKTRRFSKNKPRPKKKMVRFRVPSFVLSLSYACGLFS